MYVNRRMVIWSILIACTALVAAVLGGNSAASADVTQGFTADFPPEPPAPFRKWLQFGSDPGPQILQDGWDGPYGRVTQEVNSQNNSVAWDQLFSGSYDSLTIGMDIRVSVGNNGGADGFGLAYLNTANYGTSTADDTPGFTEEPNLSGSIGVGFDTFNNGTAGGDHEGGNELSSLSLHYDGALVESALVDGTAIPTFETGEVYRAEIHIEESGGEYIATVSLDDGVNRIEPISAVLPGFVPYDGRVALAGRTGGANSDQDVDNISIQATLGADVTDVTVDDFTVPDPEPKPPATVVGGTPFTLTQNAGGPAAQMLPDTAGAIGEQGGFLRLTNDVGSQNNVLAFDVDPNFTGPQPDGVSMEFDFRMSEESTHTGCCNERADGFGFGLFPTEAYGVSGDGPAGNWEDPAHAGALTVGFDIFADVAEGFGENRVRVYLDGALVGDVNITEFALNSGAFQHADVDVVPDGDNALLTMTITPDGADPVTIFDDLAIPGLDMNALPEFRAMFGGRTGGAFVATDLDNIDLRSIPEPGVLSLLGIGAATMALIGIWRRRNRS